MKHSLQITIILLLTFLLAQFVGIAIIYNYIDHEKSVATGQTEFKELAIGERPPIEEKTSFIPIILAILFGTGILLLLIKYNLQWVWKAWFFIAVGAALTIAFDAFTPTLIAFITSILLTGWKIFKPNFYIHTFTELFIYGGLAAIFVPILNIFSVSILMVLIMVYDAYAVWKSKHMVTLAKSQMKAKVFSGLLIPYKLPKKSRTRNKGKKTKVVRTAVLGGGDIGFPLIFAGVVLKEFGLWQSLTIPFFAVCGLGILLWKADEKKFYPAMPFIGVACFVGQGVIWLFSIL